MRSSWRGCAPPLSSGRRAVRPRGCSGAIARRRTPGRGTSAAALPAEPTGRVGLSRREERYLLAVVDLVRPRGAACAGGSLTGVHRHARRGSAHGVVPGDRRQCSKLRAPIRKRLVREPKPGRRATRPAWPRRASCKPIPRPCSRSCARSSRPTCREGGPSSRDGRCTAGSLARCSAIQMRVMHAGYSPDGRRIVTASAGQDRAGVERRWHGRAHGPSRSRGCGLFERRSAPTASASSPRPMTGPRGCGTPTARASPWSSAVTRMGSLRRRSAPMASASSPRRMTGPRGCGTPTARASPWSFAVTGQVSSVQRGVQPRRQAHRHRIRRTGPRGCGTPTARASPWSLRGHEARVSSAAFSPDGKRIVTAS